MAVPTVYAKMLEAHGKAEPETAAAWVAGLRSQASVLRLMVSGSAALPETVAKAWTALTGHTLLERYGMTEFAMAISQPLTGERRPNTVGMPLPGFSARLVPEIEGADVKDGGELQIRGPGVFSEYWGKPEATAETFTDDGWFKTGDRAIVDADGYYAIQGASSRCRRYACAPAALCAHPPPTPTPCRPPVRRHHQVRRVQDQRAGH
jgi:malonyl-CoA/methylmalonyl-CoA synthetase